VAGAGPGGLFRRGPGGSAIGEIPSELPQLADLNQDRDLVFIDQRGTGGSNGLNCPSPPATLTDRTQVRRSIKSCLDSLRGWADLRFYTITMAAEETAQVLSALHYGKVNIIGGSYGGTAAQVFQHQFPARVRTMTLQSGALLGIPLFEWFPRASQRWTVSSPAAQAILSSMVPSRIWPPNGESCAHLSQPNGPARFPAPSVGELASPSQIGACGCADGLQPVPSWMALMSSRSTAMTR
jgi:pimeloyl-ACP methyl ester carboxylesterase